MSRFHTASVLPGSKTEQLRVLVVDDVPIQRRMLAQRLKVAGYLVETAGDGEEALARVLEGAVDILITDRDMPAMDGATLCRRVREADLIGYVFIIMLTGRDSINDFISGLESGADMYVGKPAEPAELLACMNTGARILRLERDLRAAKATDALLQIYRRDYLEVQLPREVERARRYDSTLAVVMTDLDHFKRVNDTYGHLAGDQTLQEFCSRTRLLLRQSDWLARYGGEEFAIVLPQTDLAGATDVAEKVRVQCASRPVITSAGSLDVTVSLGVAALAPGGDAHEAAIDLLNRADAALCQSKRAGRNRVITATSCLKSC